MNTPVKPPKIVVFAANGEIGEKVAHNLALQMETSGNQVIVQMVTRKSQTEPGKAERPNIGEGVALEVRESFVHVNKANNAEPGKKISIERAFTSAPHVMWDQSEPDALKDALKDADAIIIPAGVPRKLNADGTTPTRSQLLGQNAEAATTFGEVIGRLAPAKTPVINCMNPADNAGTMIEEACIKAWDKRGIAAADRPAHKVVTMGGTLDESRLKVFVAETLNKELAGKDEVIPADVEGFVYGQHGEKMVIDRGSISVRGTPLNDYLSGHGLSEKANAIIKTFEEQTLKGGANLIKKRGTSARFSPAKRMAEIAFAALFSDKPYTLTASVVHKEEGESRSVGSGVRVSVSKKGIEIDPYWLEHHVKSGNGVKEAIKESRREIIADQAGYELLEFLKPYKDGIVKTGDQGQFIISTDSTLSTPELVAKAKIFDEALKLPVGTSAVRRGAPPSIVLPVNQVTNEGLTKIAKALGLDKGIPIAQKSLVA